MAESEGQAKGTQPALTRRSALKLGIGAAAASILGLGTGFAMRRLCCPSGPEASAEVFLPRGEEPFNLESPLDALTQLYTPNSLFFVRTHDDPPVIDPSTWRLEIFGDVKKPLSLSLADLKSRAQASATAVLQCAGNGRSFQRPRVPGAQWQRGACGQARWKGVPLAALLDEAGADPGSTLLRMQGADRMRMAKAPPYVRMIPIDRARHETSLVAVEMNGEPLPQLHGGPARVVLPGWTGNHWQKWVTSIRVSKEEEKSFYAAAAYRSPVEPCAPGGQPGPKGTAPVMENFVKSIIGRPSDGSVLRAGVHEAVGVAFSGMTHVTRVEVSTDGGKNWQDAALEGDDSPGAWKVWRLRFRRLTPGSLEIVSRATDARGAVQPEQAQWNPGGYLWNAWDRSTCEVRL